MDIYSPDQIDLQRLIEKGAYQSWIFGPSLLDENGKAKPKESFLTWDYIKESHPRTAIGYFEPGHYCLLLVDGRQKSREDQSVNEKVLISRIEQQIKVTKIVAGCVDLREVRCQNPKLANYMCRNVSIMMAISSIHLLLSGEEEAKTRHREIWAEMKKENPGLYYRLRYTKLSGLTNLPGRLGKKAAVDGYRIAKKIYKFQ